MIDNKQYFYYIPLVYESNLTAAIAEWTTIPNNGWTIITGVYSAASSLINGISTVKNVLKVGRVHQDILLGFENTMKFDESQPQFMALIGFTLEGDLDLFAPLFKEQLMQLDGAVCKETNTEYLEFLETLKQ
jgi:hypothetical protein